MELQYPHIYIDSTVLIFVGNLLTIHILLEENAFVLLITVNHTLIFVVLILTQSFRTDF
jgi:hypothetical protein